MDDSYYYLLFIKASSFHGRFDNRHNEVNDMSNATACMSSDCLRANQPIVTWAKFLFVTLASRIVGLQCQRVGFPTISGYLVTGIICGPDALQILQKQELSRLTYVNDFVIAYISASAGSELYLPSIQELLRSVLVNTCAIGFLTLPLCTLVGFGMGGTVLLPWQGAYPSNCRWAMSAVAGGIFMGRSPASVIAIIAELKVTKSMQLCQFLLCSLLQAKGFCMLHRSYEYDPTG